MRSSTRFFSAWVAASAFSAAPLAAQFAQYTAPGSLATDPEMRREAFERAVEEARWKLGPLRLEPVFGLSDLAYVDEQANDDIDGDLTASLTAGLRGYVPVGSRTTLALFALPEYVWWQDRTEARRLNQRLGAGVFTFFNRLGVEVTGTRMEDLSYVTHEVARRVAARSDQLGVKLEVPLGSRISIIGTGAVGRTENDLDEDVPGDAVFTALDSESRSYSGGLRWYLTPAFSLSGSVGRTETDFDEDARDRSNQGDFWGAGLAWQRPKLGVSVDVQSAKIEGEPGSEFGTFEGTTGTARLAWSPRERFSLTLYGQRRLTYSVFAEEPFALDQRTGASVGLALGHRIRLELFAEQGELDYSVEESGTSTRVDDLTSWGAQMSVQLGRRFRFSAGMRETKLDSPLPDADYKIQEILATLGLGASPGGTWY